jgi:hypothetical protein
MGTHVRERVVALLVAAAAAPVHAGSDLIFANGFDPHPGFEVATPDIVVPAQTSSTYCYYFRAPNTATLGIKRWASSMSPGMHHLILFATYDSAWNPSERQPPGTLAQIPCGFSEGGGNAAWVYAAHDPTEELLLPGDDGSGTPLAVEVVPSQPMFVQMYVRNDGSAAVTTSAVLTADALAPADAYTKSATYLAANLTLSIPSPTGGFPVQQTCAAPAGAKFWWLSTRTHHFASESRIEDAGSPLVVSTDWEHPASVTFNPPASYAFSASGMTYRCTYDNVSGAPVHGGEDEETQEACIGVGYFFPAARPMLCINDLGPL